MIFAVLGAVRGDVALFSRVIRAIEEEGIYAIFHTGNLVLGGPDGGLAAAEIQARGILGVQGMDDRLLVSLERKRAAIVRKLDPGALKALEAANAGLTSTDREWLRGLPKSMVHSIDGIEIGLCCGSPANPREVVGEDTPVQRLKRLREEMPYPVLICGSAEAYFAARLGNTLIVAPPPLAADSAHGQYIRITVDEEVLNAERILVPPA